MISGDFNTNWEEKRDAVFSWVFYPTDDRLKSHVFGGFHSGLYLQNLNSRVGIPAEAETCPATHLAISALMSLTCTRLSPRLYILTCPFFPPSLQNRQQNQPSFLCFPHFFGADIQLCDLDTSLCCVHCRCKTPFSDCEYLRGRCKSFRVGGDERQNFKGSATEFLI